MPSSSQARIVMRLPLEGVKPHYCQYYRSEGIKDRLGKEEEILKDVSGGTADTARGRPRSSQTMLCADDSRVREFSSYRFWSYRFIISPRMKPSQTANRQAAMEMAMLPPAQSHWPARARLSVCRLKEEKVV